MPAIARVDVRVCVYSMFACACACVRVQLRMLSCVHVNMCAHVYACVRNCA